MFEIDLIIPDKLIDPIFNSKKKHRVINGGRGGGKSEGVARAFIILALEGDANLLCTRSVQNSMKDSVHRLIKRIIKENDLESLFSIRDNGITCKVNGNEIMFRGCNVLSNPRSESAKGLDNVKYCWVEEAHTITDRDIEILLPSIRADEAVFFWVYNKNYEPCAVSEYFKKHSNAEITTIQYYENPFLPETLRDEAEELKSIDPQKYREVWLGEPNQDATKKIIILQWVNDAIDLFNIEKNNQDGKVVFGFDVFDGGADCNALAKRKGLALLQVYTNDKTRDTNEATDWAVDNMGSNTELVYDRVGVGSGVKARLNEKYKNIIHATPHNNGSEVKDKEEFYLPSGVDISTQILNKDMFENFGSQHWWYMRSLFINAGKKLKGDLISGDYITINPEIDFLTEIKNELTQVEFETNKKGKIQIVKTPKGCKSPNIADAIMMSFVNPENIASLIV